MSIEDRALTGSDELDRRDEQILTPGPGRRGRLRSYWRDHHEGIAQILAVATPVLTIIALILGFVLDRKSEEADALRGEKITLQKENGTLREQVAGLEGNNTVLREQNLEQAGEISQLRAQLPPQPPTGTEIPPIRKAGTITLAVRGDVIDLNSTDLNWGAGLDQDSVFGSPDLVFLTDEGLRFGSAYDNPPASVRVGPGKASYSPCAVASGYARIGAFEPIDPADLEDGRTCFRLHSGRIATITTSAITARDVTLAITVWQKP